MDDVSMSKEDSLVDALGLQNFKGDVTSSNPRVSKALTIDISKAGTKHLPKGASRFTYTPSVEKGTIYIPVNRLKQVYQTDKALDRKKVKELKEKMKSGLHLSPVQIGYNYDVHDGHHRWVAAMELGYSHVPCEVCGSNSKKVANAKIKYREVWKSESFDLLKSVSFLEDNGDLKTLVSLLDNVEDEKIAIENYKQFLQICNDSFLTPIIQEILDDEKDHLHNLQLVKEYLQGNICEHELTNNLTKSGDLAIVLDLSKGLNKAKLIQRRVAVKGKDGKTYYRMQWVKPGQDVPGMDKNTSQKEISTYGHHEEGLKELERRQSNRFPVIRAGVEDLQIDRYGYAPDKEAIAQAKKDFNAGKPLPPVRVDGDGRIVRGFEYYEMAKELGLSHIPVIVLGNTEKKKAFEDRWREETYVEEDNGDGETIMTKLTNKTAAHKDPNLPKEIQQDIEHFTKVTAKRYPKDYIMEQAIEQGIEWNPTKKNGELLPMNSSILWMRCHQAITAHIAAGKPFEIAHNAKISKKHQKNLGKDSVHDAFLSVMDSFQGSKQGLMDYMRKEGITWAEKKDPSINWMECVKAAKLHLSQGKMLNGVRTRQKDAMARANLNVTDHHKKIVRDKAEKFGKATVMERADQLGIAFSKVDKKGNPLAMNSRILWMRASQAIAEYIAGGNEFLMDGEEPDRQGLTGETDVNQGLSMWQQRAIDWTVRNSREQEKITRDYAIKCLSVDHEISSEQAEEMYNQFMEKARNAKVMIKIDPFEMLPSGVSLIDQLSSDGEMKNNIMLNRGWWDEDHINANEGDLFGEDYTTEIKNSERPVYGIVDIYNTGLSTGSRTNYHGGDVAFVMKSDIKTRTTACHIDSNSFQYGEEGKWTKPMTDPHQIVIDRMRYKWSKPNKKDGQRKRAMEAILRGERFTDDSKYFECHFHGKVDLRNDVDHILVPARWKTDTEFSKQHQKMQEFAKLMGVGIKYE